MASFRYQHSFNSAILIQFYDKVMMGWLFNKGRNLMLEPNQAHLWELIGQPILESTCDSFFFFFFDKRFFLKIDILKDHKQRQKIKYII